MTDRNVERWVAGLAVALLVFVAGGWVGNSLAAQTVKQAKDEIRREITLQLDTISLRLDRQNERLDRIYDMLEKRE